MKSYSTLLQLAEELNCPALQNESMSKHTTFKIGGNADVFITVPSKDALCRLVRLCRGEEIPVFLLGNGSNLLVSDQGIRGAVLALCGEFEKIRLVDETTIECGAAVTLAKLCQFALKESLSGLEFAWGIPGSVGGAAYMNAGAYGGEMKDVLLSCYHVTPDGVPGTLKKEELDLSYRHSAYTDNGCVITSVKVGLKRENPLLIRERMEDYMARRKSKQPLEFPSAGSVFKRPAGYFAGALIEGCGLKGKRVGGACVSDKHAGFIINDKNATCRDVENLVREIQETVREKTGVSLECEIKTVR